MPAVAVAAIEAAVRRLVHSHDGSTGSAARRSTKIRATAATAATAKTVKLAGEFHAQVVPPCSSPRISMPAATRTRAEPR